MRSGTSLLVAAVFASGLLLSACGDDGEDGDSGGAPTATVPAATATPPAPTATAVTTSTPTELAATTTPEPTITSSFDGSTPTAAPTSTPTESDNPVVNLRVDQTIELPGLSGVVDVAFDSLGIPHIYGPDEASVLFVQGYETAKARFWQMDVFRRFAEGRLSELFGELTVGNDAQMRTLFTTRDGRRLEEAMWELLQEEAPDLAALGQAYADGVNAWLADLRSGRNGATLPPEYSFFLIAAGPDDLAEWRPQDTLAIGRLQAFSLSYSAPDEIEAARAFAALPEPLLLDVFRSAPLAAATILPASESGVESGAAARLPSRSLVSAAPLREIRAMFDRLREANPLTRGQDEFVGSNNWIVAPELSATGHAILANDPHLALFSPPIWHMVQLDAEQGIRVNGVNFPGLPGIILGHNDFGAWGATTSAYDVTDAYIETITTPPDYPASPRTVLFDGEQVAVLRIEEPIRLKGGDEIPLVIEIVPHHGPMLPDPNLNDDVDGLAATGMTIRWTGHEVTLDSKFLFGLNRARNVSEFMEAVRSFATGGQNWIWADLSGDIAYFPFVLVPQRPPGTVPFLPLPGTGEAEWLRDESGETLWVPEEKLPQATNPARGYVASANNDPIGNTLDNDPLNDDVYLGFTFDAGFRAQRIDDLLSNRAGVRPEGAKMTLEDMSAYQYDTVSLEASRLVPFLVAAAGNRPDLVTPEMADALDRLRAWGESKEGSAAWDMVSGVDPAEMRSDVPPRATPVTEEERADAVAASIYAAWSTRLGRAVFTDDFDGTGIGIPGGDFGLKGLLHILEDIDRTDPGFIVHTKGENGESTLWDDKGTPEVETRDEILLGALANGLGFLAERTGSTDPASWLWGKIHQVRFQHFFGQSGLDTFDLGNFPAPGGRETVNPAGYSLNGDRFIFSSGPSERFVAILDPAGIRAVNILPGGNNGNPGGLGPRYYNRIQPDIHFGDHAPDWINGSTFEYRITREAVAADTQLHLRYLPAMQE